MNIKIKKIFSVIFAVFFVLFFPVTIFAGPFDYTPMEKIPGFEVSGSFPDYILAIYKFGIWAVGIAALLMIMIGGFMYITSAGNNASMEKAKGIIFDAIAGVILALTAYLLLYVINPELTKIKIISETIDTAGSGSNGTESSGTGNAGTGKCKPLTSGPCSVENLQKTCFKDNAIKASSICSAESGGKEKIASGTDKCQPGGQSVSWGLFQINISANNILPNHNCANNAASPTYTGKNRNCTPQKNYDTCVKAACNPDFNIQTACSISKNGTKWSAWGANRLCGF